MMADTTKMEKYHDPKGKDNPYTPKVYNLPSGLMQITKETPGYIIVAQFSSIYFERSKNGGADISNVSGKYLIKIK
jgi:hypothetical protein